MARIQILQLPPYGRDGEQPFALIVDQCTTPPQRVIGVPAEPESVRSFGLQVNPAPPVEFTDGWQKFGQEIGARSVMVTPETVDIVGDEPVDKLLVEFDQAALLDTVAAAVRTHLESPTEHHFHFAPPTLDAKRLGKLAEERTRRQRGEQA